VVLEESDALVGLDRAGVRDERDRIADRGVDDVLVWRRRTPGVTSDEDTNSRRSAPTKASDRPSRSS
jgi:hypothetical protein